MNDDQIKSILRKSKVIAMIGVSSEKKGEDKKNLKRKPANVVMKYMQNFGYKVIPINPFAVGEVVNGEPMVESLDKIKEEIDIVDVFRPSNETEGIAKEAIKKGTKVLWLQYGIHSDEAQAIADRENVEFISNRCIKQEYQKLFQKSNPVYAGEKADEVVLDHRKKIDESDLIVLVAPIWNYRMPAILEGWIDKVLAPPWAFSFKKLIGNHGYAVGKLKSKKAIIFCTYGSPRFSITDFFLNLPLRRIKKGIFNKCGIYDIAYKRYFAVPFVSNEKRIEFLEDVKNTASNL